MKNFLMAVAHLFFNLTVGSLLVLFFNEDYPRLSMFVTIFAFTNGCLFFYFASFFD